LILPYFLFIVDILTISRCLILSQNAETNQLNMEDIVIRGNIVIKILEQEEEEEKEKEKEKEKETEEQTDEEKEKEIAEKKKEKAEKGEKGEGKENSEIVLVDGVRYRKFRPMSAEGQQYIFAFGVEQAHLNQA